MPLEDLPFVAGLLALIVASFSLAHYLPAEQIYKKLAANERDLWIQLDALCNLLRIENIAIKIAIKATALALGLMVVLSVMAFFVLLGLSELLFFLVVFCSFFTAYIFYKLLAGTVYFGGGSERVLALLFALGITASWIFYPNIATLNAAAFIAATTVLALLKAIFFRPGILKTAVLRAIAVILCGFVLYDIFAVFATNLMQTVAEAAVAAAPGGKPLPLLFIVPSELSLHASPVFYLGLGDVVLPGLLVLYAFHEGSRLMQKLLPCGTLIGYALGLAASVTAVYLFNTPQPATIYLVPATAAGLFAAAWVTGTLKEIAWQKKAV